MNRKNFKILFYPQRPSKHSTIYKIVKMLNCEIINNLQKQCDLIVAWEDITFRNLSLLPPESNTRIVNEWCNDISKDKVNNEFSNIFNYSTFIDPVIFIGKCVKKSNLNAKHDGKIIECPIVVPEDGFVYQKLVNNTNDEWEVYDIRTFIFNRTIPFVLIKQKNESQRFRDHFTLSLIKDTHFVFAQEEIDKIIEFSQRIGLDYGELDILRDSDDNRIYIIDANNTPWWSTSLPETETKYAISTLAEKFKNEFMTLETNL